MNAPRLWTAALTLGLAGALGVSQETNDGLEERVQALEAELQSVTGYLQAQATSEQALSKAMDLSEAEGFTYGINPESRRILLNALRERAAAAQKQVPGQPQKPADGTKARRR